MPIINPASIKLKLKIRFSVLRTVLKFLFSLVRKYFCCLVRVEIWPDSLSTVSSTPESCSGDAPDFWGRFARGSSSTCVGGSVYGDADDWKLLESYSNLKVNELVRESGHGVVEAKPVLADLVCREYVVALTLFLAVQNHTFLTRLLTWSVYRIVNCSFW